MKLTDNVLEIRDLVKDFPSVRAVNNVSFDIKRNSVHCLVGENGAGKSTLIKILGGVYSCDQGRLLLDGEPIYLRGPRDAHQKGIRVIHQELNLLPLLSVAENIHLGNLPTGRLPGTVNWRALQAQAQQALGRMGVALDVTRHVRELTTAEQQLVEIAQALTTESRILIMDIADGKVKKTSQPAVEKFYKTYNISYYTMPRAEAIKWLNTQFGTNLK